MADQEREREYSMRDSHYVCVTTDVWRWEREQWGPLQTSHVGQKYHSRETDTGGERDRVREGFVKLCVLPSQMWPSSVPAVTSDSVCWYYCLIFLKATHSLLIRPPLLSLAELFQREGDTVRTLVQVTWSLVVSWGHVRGTRVLSQEHESCIGSRDHVSPDTLHLNQSYKTSILSPQSLEICTMTDKLTNYQFAFHGSLALGQLSGWQGQIAIFPCTLKEQYSWYFYILVHC